MLRKALEGFSMTELKGLCHDLNVNHERFKHDSIRDISLGLIDFMQRHNRLEELIQEMEQHVHDNPSAIKRNLSHLNISSSLENLFKSPRYFGFELYQLQRLGFVVTDEEMAGGWAIRPAAFLWWAADIIIKIVDDGLENWLKEQGLTTQFSEDEKPQIKELISALSAILDTGAFALIQKTIDNPEVFFYSRG